MSIFMKVISLTGFVLFGGSAIYAGWTKEYTEGIYHMLWAGYFLYSLEKDN
jgi:hypothetical protein